MKFISYLLFVFTSLFFDQVAQAVPAWVPIKTLDVIGDEKRGGSLNLQKVHQALAEEEKKVSNYIPRNEARNVVIARIGLVIENERTHTHRLVEIPLGNEGKDIVFDSSQTTVFSRENVLAELGDLTRSITSLHHPSKAVELGEAQLRLYSLMQRTQSFLEDIFRKFDFYSESIPLETIFGFARRTARLSIMARYPQYGSLVEKNEHLLEEANRELEGKSSTEQRKFERQAQAIADHSRDLTHAREALELAIKETQKTLGTWSKHLEEFKEIYQRKVSEIVGELWHSEPKFVHFLGQRVESLRIPELQDGERVVFMFLNLHSRFDICDVCSPMLLANFFSPDSDLPERLSRPFGLRRDQFALTTSFREFRKNMWGDAEIQRYKEDIERKLTDPLYFGDMLRVFDREEQRFLSTYVGDFSEFKDREQAASAARV